MLGDKLYHGRFYVRYVLDGDDKPTYKGGFSSEGELMDYLEKSEEIHGLKHKMTDEPRIVKWCYVRDARRSKKVGDFIVATGGEWVAMF